MWSPVRRRKGFHRKVASSKALGYIINNIHPLSPIYLTIMPIDEFGREIPAAGGGGSTPHNDTPFADPLRSDPAHPAIIGGSSGVGGGGGGVNPLLMGGELSAPRDSSAGGDNNGGDNRRHEYRSSHRGRGRGGRHNSYRGGRPRADSSGYSDDHRRRGGNGNRRHRSRSHGNEGDGRSGGDNHSRHRPSSNSHSHRGGKVKRAHASERYSEQQPMLCQFLWKKELENEQAKKLNLDKPQEEEGNTTTMEKEESVVKVEADTSIENIAENNNNNATSEANPQEEEQDGGPPPLFESPEAEEEAYNDFNQKYCLNYVRNFFNQHIDDPWYRVRLSPLETHRQVSKELKRAKMEASELKKEIQQSLEDMKSGVIPKKDDDCAEYLGPPKCNFVAACRLGVGTKPTHHHHHHHHHMYDNQYNNNDHHENEIDMQHNVLQGEDRNRIERHAKSHLHSFIKTESCIKIMDVPPNVSDGQLLHTLRGYVGKGDQPPSAVHSDDVCLPRHDNESMDPYHRTAYAVFPSGHAKDCMLEGLHKANEEANRSHHRGGRHRKGGDALPRVLDLDVDATDIYGRSEIDNDGKGGAPPTVGKKKEVDKLPSKRCTVYISTSLLSPSQPVSVLSAAVSSRKRISQDKQDAATIAGIYDEIRGIEAGSRLNDLLRLLYPGNELQAADDEDILDVSIAYLRRVHLFSFYNGCTVADKVGNVLSFRHPTGTIHLRLRDADEILDKAAEEAGPTSADADETMAEGDENNEGRVVKKESDDAVKTKADNGKDLLVLRHNTSISKALEEIKTLAGRGASCLIDAKTDADAQNIESVEQSFQDEWIKNHSIFDEDGRARCAFHYCRKLFKDKAFLHKHLIKKHSDQLRCELAKCHDGPMMTAWDNDERRPVPPVLIDCGSKFGLVPSPIIGSALPTANDPEPQLWKEEQERIAEVERRQQEREAAARAHEEEMQRRRETANAGEKRKSNFVDPDDMVEEKVELSFENVEVVAPPPKKKKKKRKSLL